MATIVTRSGKGSALTWTEGDNNFSNLNTELGNKVASVSGTAGRITVGGTATAPTVDLSSGVVSPASVTYASITVDTYGRVTALSSGTAPVTSVSGTAGRISSSGGTTPSLDLVSGIATAGTYAGRVTVDTYGRITAATNDVTGYTEPIYDLGTTGGTIAPNVANGNVQKITLNAALTINAFTSPVAGQSLTLIIYGGTAYTSITSTMKFAGGIKTLTGTASCIDILSVYYDGTTYFASLNKGFA
jgi:hypothetical protein